MGLALHMVWLVQGGSEVLHHKQDWLHMQAVKGVRRAGLRVLFVDLLPRQRWRALSVASIQQQEY